VKTPSVEGLGVSLKVKMIPYADTSAVPNVKYYRNIGTSRLDYLQKTDTAEAQILQSGYENQYYLDPEGGDAEVLFGLSSTGSYSLSLVMEREGCPDVAIDTCRVYARDINKMFLFGSLRGSPSVNYTYNTDKTMFEDIQIVPDMEMDLTGFGNYNNNLDKYLLNVHGFNVNLSDAKASARVMFRRAYWTGFRGNFINITWKGDGWNGIFVFDDAVSNALQTSPSLMYYINQLHTLTSADKISIMAHSLGNLVVWDALRLYRRTYSDYAAVNDVLSIEAAVWIETFLPEADIEYLESDGDVYVKYDIDSLMHHSWAFWFNQKIGSNNRAANTAISGKYYHSFNALDYALAGMQTLNYINAIRGDASNHYERVNPNYRIPSDLWIYPAMIDHGRRKIPYFATDLTPAGTTFNPGYSDLSIIALDGGWSEISHSAFKCKEFYKIYPWYKSTVWQILNNWKMVKEVGQ